VHSSGDSAGGAGGAGGWGGDRRSSPAGRDGEPCGTGAEHGDRFFELGDQPGAGGGVALGGVGVVADDEPLVLGDAEVRS
jgi:hypothetical protein